ncbi:type II toxin-antitoxin system ParD family antitoxin [Rubrimonas sp.]|uniref:type II toxin-antitoxin system ParD family antitoxin n=1 Tax=Rubrimonas sp. TaxID=2036015 RepID=UPI002FDD72C2
MPRNTSVIVGDHFAQFIAEKVGEGRYASASDVVRAGLRLLEEREAGLSAVRAAIDEGERSGEPAPLDIDAFVVERRARA